MLRQKWPARWCGRLGGVAGSVVLYVIRLLSKNTVEHLLISERYNTTPTPPYNYNSLSHLLLCEYERYRKSKEGKITARLGANATSELVGAIWSTFESIYLTNKTSRPRIPRT
jgi:hypothetical protein